MKCQERDKIKISMVSCFVTRVHFVDTSAGEKLRQWCIMCLLSIAVCLCFCLM